MVGDTALHLRFKVPSFSMHLALGGSVYGCVRWVGMPSLPEGTANDTALYGASGKLWGANVARARKLVREPGVGFDWRLAKCSHVRPGASSVCCTYGLRVVASCVAARTEGAGQLAPGRAHTVYVPNPNPNVCTCQPRACRGTTGGWRARRASGSCATVRCARGSRASSSSATLRSVR